MNCFDVIRSLTSASRFESNVKDSPKITVSNIRQTVAGMFDDAANFVASLFAPVAPAYVA